MARISFLIDSPLRDLQLVMRALPDEVRKQIPAHTKTAAEPIWKQETAQRSTSRLQIRVLSDSAKVGVTQRNVFLRSGAVGRLSSGTAVADLVRSAEFGANPDRPVQATSTKGKAFTRKLGPKFGPLNRHGNVVYPAAWQSLSRFASLWVQTTYRTVHEQIEKVN